MLHARPCLRRLGELDEYEAQKLRYCAKLGLPFMAFSDCEAYNVRPEGTKLKLNVGWDCSFVTCRHACHIS